MLGMDMERAEMKRASAGEKQTNKKKLTERGAPHALQSTPAASFTWKIVTIFFNSGMRHLILRSVSQPVCSVQKLVLARAARRWCDTRCSAFSPLLICSHTRTHMIHVFGGVNLSPAYSSTVAAFSLPLLYCVLRRNSV